MHVPSVRTAALLVVLALGAMHARSGVAEDAPVPPAAPAPAAEGPGPAAPLLLRTAVERGLLRARGHSPSSYSSVRLELSNAGEQAVAVDLCGSFLKPQGSKPCQRLGLGPVITPGGGAEPKRRPGAVVVTVAAGSTLSLHVATVCLDVSKACPTDQSFSPAAEGLSEVRERVMRWWADHPETPQGDVNSAIWRSAPEVEVRGGTGRPPPREFAPLRGTVRSGTTYLIKDGALLSRDADRVERFLATRIVDVFPVEGALYAVAEVGTALELWRYVETGDEQWKRMAPLPAGLEIRTLEVLPGGGLLVPTPSQLLRLVPERGVFETVVALPKQAKDLSYQVLPRNRLRVGFTLPNDPGVFRGGEQEHARSARSELWLHDLARPKLSERMKTYWNVAGIAQGPGGAFAITNAGTLRVLRGDSFQDQPGADGLEQILHVGREYVWAGTRDGGLVTLRVDTGAFTRVEAPMTALKELRFDDAVDAAALRGGALVRVDAATGTLTVLERAPSRDPSREQPR